MPPIAGPADEPRQTRFRADHGAPAAVDLQALCCSLRRRAQGQALLLSRPISVHGICATHMERELARYRSLPASTQHQALPSRHPRQCRPQHSGQRQRNARLAHLLRLRPTLNRDCAAALCRGTARIELKDTVYALDLTTIDLCLSVFSWAPFRSTKAAVKFHTLLDLRGSIPSFIFISDGKFHDVNVLDHLVPEPGAFYVMDRAYIDFERLARLSEAGSFFVTRAKSNFKAQRRYSHAVDRATGLVCDQTVILTGFYSRKR